MEHMLKKLWMIGSRIFIIRILLVNELQMIFKITVSLKLFHKRYTYLFENSEIIIKKHVLSGNKQGINDRILLMVKHYL